MNIKNLFKKQVVTEQPVSVVPVAEASFGDKLNNIKSVSKQPSQELKTFRVRCLRNQRSSTEELLAFRRK